MAEHEETTEQDILATLKQVEATVIDRLSQVHAQHVELTGADYDNDIRFFRPHLDLWMEWQQWTSYWLVQVKLARNAARDALREGRMNLVDSMSQFAMEQEMKFSGAYEERKLFYERKTLTKVRRLEQLEQLVEVMVTFQGALKNALDHWDKRRVDTKWELDRMHRLPGSDYQS